MTPARRPSQEDLDGLCALFDDATAVTFAADDLEHYGRDWTRVEPPAPSAVVFPRTIDEVSRVLAWASKTKVAVVPSGGRTGLAGGAVAAHGEIVLSLERMRTVSSVDTLGQTVAVEAGAITADVHAHVATAGLFWPVDFASKGSSQVGGNLSTNAGGIRVVRYGSASRWVLGLDVVLMDGTILRLGGALEKDNTGLDLKALFLRSEGTLGVICRATLKLCPLPQPSAVLLLATSSLQDAAALFKAARSAPFELAAFEVLTDACLDVVLPHLGGASPLASRSPAYVVVEFEAGKGAPNVEETTALTTWFEAQRAAHLALDGVIATTGHQREKLWAVRERISESLAARGRVHKNDVAVAVKDVPAFVSALDGVYERTAPHLEVYIFGHLGDGNLHLNLVAPSGAVDDATFFAETTAADAAVYPLIQQFGGSVSAEHGVGTLKVDALPYTRSAVEIALMRTIKRALDPAQLLNPGKIFAVDDDTPSHT